MSRVSLPMAAFLLVVSLFVPGQTLTPAFDAAMVAWGPASLGPDLGAPAPDLGGFPLAGRRTVVVLTTGFLGPDTLPFLKGWTEVAPGGVRLAAASLSAERVALGDAATCVEGADARAALDAYGLGPLASPLLLLVDEFGRVAYREPLFGAGYWTLRTDEVVRGFLAGGSLDAAPPRHVLGPGELAPWPACGLLDASGAPVAPRGNAPRLILKSAYYPTDGELPALPATIDALRQEYPEVEFVWLVSTWSRAASALDWEYGQRLGWNIDLPDTYGIPQSEFVAVQQQSIGVWSARVVSDLAWAAPHWSVWLDVDDGLAGSWGFPPVSSVMVLDRSGRVVLPPTQWPRLVDSTTGRETPDLEAVGELRTFLDEASR